MFAGTIDFCMVIFIDGEERLSESLTKLFGNTISTFVYDPGSNPVLIS